jgi:hypothetical protein
MIGKVRPLRRLALVVGLSACVMALSLVQDASAQRRMGGARPQAHVSRQGPARSGSFDSNRQRGAVRRDERPAPDRSPRVDPADRRDGAPDRRDAPGGLAGERGRVGEGRQIDDRGRDDRYDDRPHENIDRERVEERRDDRRDYYDDRRDYYDERRAFVRGARYSAVWWTSNSCVNAVVVKVDGYTYYQCNSAWFSRTYYGGEVTYTVTDAPAGY